MTKLSLEEARRVAELARLELSTEELTRLTGDLRTILERFDAIRRPETGEGTDAGADTPATPVRPDQPDPDPLKRPPASFAPTFQDGFFVVPRLPALDADIVEEEHGPGPSDRGGG